MKTNDYERLLGDSYIALAFQAAREAGAGQPGDPRRLFYNDYRIMWSRPKADAVYNLLKARTPPRARPLEHAP